MALPQEQRLHHRLPGSGDEGSGAPRESSVREPILIAEDDPVLALVLNGYLARLGFAVHTTDSFQEASRWLERDGGPLVLDGSVFKRMGTPLGELSKRVIIWSGDWELVQEARELGLRALYKGNLKDIDGLLREMAGPERSKS